MATAAVRRAGGQRGFTLIDLLFVIALIGLLSTLAIPGLMRARGVAQSASAAGTLRVVNSAQLSFAISCGLGFYAPDFPALATRPAGAVEGFLPADLASGETFVKSGYLFSMAGESLAGAPASCNGVAAGRAAPAYAVIADQLDAQPGRGRFYGTNAEGVLYEHTSSLAPIMPELGAPTAGAPMR